MTTMMSTSSMTTSRHLQAHDPDDKDPSLLADIKPGQYHYYNHDHDDVY